jgi:RimJ/RimL family protein N-acetyltransferase
MNLRPATIEDAEMLLRWRNDPETRANSFVTAEIDLATHLNWLRQSLGMSGRRIFIGLHEGVPVGTVRTDFGNERIEISWTVAPEVRGQGLGKKMVCDAVEFLNHPPTLFARIKNGNVASEKIARAAGIVFTLY